MVINFVQWLFADNVLCIITLNFFIHP